MARFQKKTALTLLALFRQGELSVHRGMCESQWQRFLSFYDEHRRDQITKLMDLLRESGAIQGIAIDRKEIERSDLVNLLSALHNLAVNRFKQSWSFSVREIGFFFTTLQHLLEFLERTERPSQEEFLELRMDCYCSWYIIGRRLCGLRETKDVDNIEHFNQNEYRKHFTLEELGIGAAETDASPVHTTR